MAYLVGSLIKVVPEGRESLGSIPYFSFDDKRISFNAPITWETDLDGNNISPYPVDTDSFIIEVNESLYNLLDGLLETEHISVLDDKKVYQLLVCPNPSNSNIVPQYKDLNSVQKKNIRSVIDLSKNLVYLHTLG